MPLLKQLGRALIGALPTRTALPVLSGPLRGASWIVRSSNASCWLGTYERETQAALIVELREGDCFVDAGAHVGFFTLLGARLVGGAGRVLAVEPLRRNGEILKRHLQLNRVNNTTVLGLALSDAGGWSMLGSPGPTSCARLGVAGEQVETRRLDDVLAEHAVGPVRLVKIDVEGEEARLLAGAERLLAQNPPPALVVATHGWRAHEATLEQLAARELRPLAETMDRASGNGTVRFRAEGWK